MPNEHSENPYSLVDLYGDYFKKIETRNGYFFTITMNWFELLSKNLGTEKKAILFGVSFALLDFSDSFPKYPPPPTSSPLLSHHYRNQGMKQQKEMTKDEL